MRLKPVFSRPNIRIVSVAVAVLAFLQIHYNKHYDFAVNVMNSHVCLTDARESKFSWDRAPDPWMYCEVAIPYRWVLGGAILVFALSFARRQLPTV
jgi:hypothetical protein